MSGPPSSAGKLSILFTHLELVAVVAVWAGTFVSLKFVLAQVPPSLAALLRYLIASFLLVGLGRGRRERIEPADWKRLVVLGLTGVTCYYLLQNLGIRWTNATDASVLVSLSPVFMGLISWVFLRERLAGRGAAGLALAFAGAMLVISDGRPFWEQAGTRVWGDLLILGTAISWAVYSVAGKKMLGRYSVLTLTTWTTLIGTAFLLPFAAADLAKAGSWPAGGARRIGWVIWLHLLYLGGAASVYGYLAWYRALTRLPAVTVGSYLYLRPLFAGILSAIILHDAISPFLVAGGVLIIGGTWLTASRAGSAATPEQPDGLKGTTRAQ